MSATVKVDNYGSVNIREEAQLNAVVAAAASALVLNNTQNIAANDYLLIGARGTQSCELLPVLSNDSATGVTLSSPLKLPHVRFEPVVKVFGNKIKLYRAPNVDGTQPADAAFVYLDIFDIDADQFFTYCADPNGSSAYWYKFTYYNSATTAETSLADSGCARGGVGGNYCSIDDIRQKAGLMYNTFITDAMIDVERQSAQAIINSKLSGVYTLPFTAPISPLIRKITILLAAGAVLLGDYGPLNNLSTADGQSKIDEAMGLLDQLDVKTLVLTDASGVDTSIPGSANGYSGWPDVTTAAALPENGGGDFMIRVSDRY